MKVPSRATHALVFLALVGYVALVGSLVRAWNTDPPAGYGGDTFKQLYKTEFVSDFFPNVGWDYRWAAGIPAFRAYPLWPYYLVAAVSRVGGFAFELSLAVIAFVFYVLIGFGMYLATYHLTKNSMVSFSTALFLLGTPVIWSIYVVNGLFNEIVGLGFFPFVLLLGFKVAEKGEQELAPTRDFKLLILLSAAAISFHPLIGMASFLSAGLVVFFSKIALAKRIAFALGGLLLVLGLDCYLVLPLVTSALPNVVGAPASLHVTTDLLGRLFTLPSSQSSFALQPWAWPLALATIALAVYGHVALSRRSIALISLLLVSVLLTMVTGQLAVNFNSFVLLGFFLAITSGTLVGSLSKVPRKELRLAALALTALILFASIATPIALSYGKSEQAVLDPTLLAAKDLRLPLAEVNHRIAISGADPWTSQWFNYRFDIPQTSSYAGMSLINVDWNTWFGEIWKETLTPSQTRFLLDWWGVKWILIDAHINSPRIFLEDPQDFVLVANSTGENYLQFLYTRSSPIIAPINARAILVVGDDAAYNSLFRALSFADYGSREAIPVRGTRNIDDYSLEELRSFDLVLLYGFAFRDRDKAFRLLDQYVFEGGAALIDTGYSAVSSSSQLPESFPVSMTSTVDFGMSWQFTSVPSQILSGIDLQEFAPAAYGMQPWGVSATSNSSVRAWAKPILWDAGHPIIVEGSYGKGHVLWTGLNLAYHILSYGNSAESQLLSRMIEWAASRSISETDFEMYRPDPQHLTISVKSKARGILFKENFFPGWKANVKLDTFHELKIWRAGPDFMYVRLPDDHKLPLEVSFEFAGDFTQVLGLVFSAISLAMLVYSDRIARFAKRSILGSLRRRIEDFEEMWVEE